MTMSELAEKVGELLDDFKEKIIPYWHVVRDYGDLPGRLSDQHEPDSIDVDRDGDVTLSIEYNGSCQCHPEKFKKEFYLTSRDLELSAEEFRDKMKDIYLVKEQRKQEHRDKLKKAETERIKAKELAELKRLQEKYS